jgi:hypothetical protein
VSTNEDFDMNKDTAIAITKQWYSKAADPSLTYMLEKFSVVDSGGARYYRPFIVAALMISSEQKTLIKADVATWEKNEESFKNLLNLQSTDDCLTGITIPDSISVEKFLATVDSGADSGLGVMIV